jgi:AcrR family transcriptional regulator
MSTTLPDAASALPVAATEATTLQRSDQILSAAIEVFAAKGFASTDVQEIANRAGVGKGTVYRHFGTKEGLFLAAADQGVKQLRAAIDAAAEAVTDPLDRLRVATYAFLTFFDTHPELVELVIQERAHFRDRETPTFFDRKCDSEQAQRWREDLARLDILRELPVETIMDIIGQFLFGAVFVNYFAGRKKPLAHQSEEIVDVIFHGILKPQIADRHA